MIAKIDVCPLSSKLDPMPNSLHQWRRQACRGPDSPEKKKFTKVKPGKLQSPLAKSAQDCIQNFGVRFTSGLEPLPLNFAGLGAPSDDQDQAYREVV